MVGYTVRGDYRTLIDGVSLNLGVPLISNDLLWRKGIPLKVLIFAWRLFRNRLPYKANLCRGIIQFDDQMCVGGCGVQETNEHLFLNCGDFAQLWQLVRNWLHVFIALPSNTEEHFLQFGSASGHARSRCSFMFMIWFATSWVIWKERNNIIFRGEEKTTLKLLENIKLLFFWWHKANCVAFSYQFHDWCQNLLLCLGGT